MTDVRRPYPVSALLLLVLMLLLMLAADLGAQQVPDPNRQRENILRDLEYFEEREGPAEKPSDRPVIKGGAVGGKGTLSESGGQFELAEIRFNESAFIDQSTLNEIAADYVNRPVQFADLNEMIGRINALYAERGIISARALVPPQTVENAVLEVRLVEGRLGELEINGTHAIRDSFIASRLPLSQGDVVDIPALREALTRLNRTTELAVRSALRAGEAPGETDMILQVEEPARVAAQVFADNLGSESTGDFRGGALLQVYSPLGVDDRLSLYGVGSEGAVNGFIGYRFPFNRSGGRVDLSYSQGDIEITDGPFVPLNITGDSTSYDVSLTQAFQRGRHFWLDVYLGGSWAESVTEISGAALSEFDVARYALGVNLRGFGADSAWTLRQGISRAEVDNLFDETSSLVLFGGDGSYLYRLTDRWSGQARAGWQYSKDDSAPSPLLFQIGGVSSVRGYPEGALAGARGYFLNLEARHQWSAHLAPFAFVDHGLVDDISPDRETISSAGVGLGWQYGRYLSGELSWGQTLEDVLPDQDSGRLHARIALSWSGL